LVLGKRPKGRAATEYVAPIFLAWALSELNEPDKTRALLQESLKQSRHAGAIKSAVLPPVTI